MYQLVIGTVHTKLNQAIPNVLTYGTRGHTDELHVPIPYQTGIYHPY